MKADIQQIEDLNHLFFQIISHIFLTPYSNETFNELTGAQKKVLFFISAKGPQRMSEIARQVSVTMAAATAVVEKLVKGGMVERKQDPGDRRVVEVELTPAGKRAVKLINRMHEKSLEEILEHLDADERRDLISSFKRIHDLLAQIQQSRNEKPAQKASN